MEWRDNEPDFGGTSGEVAGIFLIIGMLFMVLIPIWYAESWIFYWLEK